MSGFRVQRTEVRGQKTENRSRSETNCRISKEKKTSSFEIPCSIFDIQNRGIDCWRLVLFAQLIRFKPTNSTNETNETNLTNHCTEPLNPLRGKNQGVFQANFQTGQIHFGQLKLCGFRGFHQDNRRIFN